MHKKSLLSLKCLGNLLKFIKYMKIYFKIKEIVDFNVSQQVGKSFRNFIRKIKKKQFDSPLFTNTFPLLLQNIKK